MIMKRFLNLLAVVKLGLAYERSEGANRMYYTIIIPSQQVMSINLRKESFDEDMKEYRREYGVTVVTTVIAHMQPIAYASTAALYKAEGYIRAKTKGTK